MSTNVNNTERADPVLEQIVTDCTGINWRRPKFSGSSVLDQMSEIVRRYEACMKELENEPPRTPTKP